MKAYEPISAKVTLTIEEWKTQQQLVLEGLPERCHWQQWDRVKGSERAERAHKQEPVN